MILIPATYDESKGRIEFPAGICELDAETVDGVLKIRLHAGDPAALESLEEVVARHLKRFALRETLEVNSTRGA